MRIGIDVDGCLYPWTRAANEALMARFGIGDPGEHQTWDYIKGHLTPEQWSWLFSVDSAEMVYGRLDLIYPQASDVVNALAEEHDVHFVTHRNPGVTGGITARWLAYHFDGYRGVHVLDDSCVKWELGRWDVFIDDKPETVAGFIHATDAVVLMPDRPWNRHVPTTAIRPHRFEVFGSWDAVAWLIAEACA